MNQPDLSACHTLMFSCRITAAGILFRLSCYPGGVMVYLLQRLRRRFWSICCIRR